MRSFSIVVAADRAMGIGKNGGLPWRLRKDMAFFAKITSKVVQGAQDATTTGELTHQRRVNACIMGRKTWESIPKKFRPLTDRFNVIVSRDPHYLDDKPEKGNPLVALATSFEAALDLISPSEYQLLPSTESHEFLENYLQESVEGGVIEEGSYQYEYTVYNRI
ncbi:dihydrofolate reductase [Linnemannia elongata]|nr:dihydrofolate reductase [Linnemannia elongata]